MPPSAAVRFGASKNRIALSIVATVRCRRIGRPVALSSEGLTDLNGADDRVTAWLSRLLEPLHCPFASCALHILCGGRGTAGKGGTMGRVVVFLLTVMSVAS